MPYLSKVPINPLRAQARRFAANPHAVHAAVLGGIARQPVSERLLWRMNIDQFVPSRADRGELLVLSESRPSFDHIVEQCGFPGADGGEVRTRDYEPLLALLVNGREFAFRVRVNPVRSVKNPVDPSTAHRRRSETGARMRGARLGHVTSDQQRDWFVERTQRRWGFVVPDGRAGEPDLRMAGRQRWQFAKGDKGHRHRVTLQTATFDGRLRITDVELFRSSLLGGIGPAKGYGCGLLTLASLPDEQG